MKEFFYLLFNFFQESQKAKDDFANIQRLNDEINEKLVLREKELEKLQKDMQQLQEAKKSELVILVNFTSVN